MTGVFSHPLDLHRKGSDDQARHLERLGEAIRKKLPDLIADESIIASDPKGRTVRFPVRSLGQYRFRHDSGKSEGGAAQGPGDGSLKPGDVIGKGSPGQAPGTGPGPGEPGDGEGDETYDVEIDLETLVQMMMEHLNLPRLEEKGSKKQIHSEEDRWDDLARKGSIANIDRRRSVLNNIKRNARKGSGSVVGGFNRDDLRFRTWREEDKEVTAAVVYLMMDTSGSMTTERKFLARSFFYWMASFLRTRYQMVEIVFISHDTAARLVDEDVFFHKGSSGGTKCTSALTLMKDHLGENYDLSEWNVYAFHVSDGDNPGSDSKEYAELLRRMLPTLNLFGYGDIQASSNFYSPGSDSALMQALEGIKEENLALVAIEDQQGVWPALQRFFGAEQAALQLPSRRT